MPTVVENQMLSMLSVLVEGQRKLEAGQTNLESMMSSHALAARASRRFYAQPMPPMPPSHSTGRDSAISSERQSVRLSVQSPGPKMRTSLQTVADEDDEEDSLSGAFFSSRDFDEGDDRDDFQTLEPAAPMQIKFKDLRHSLASEMDTAQQDAAGWVLPATWPKCLRTRDFLGISDEGIASGDIVKRLGSRYGKAVVTKSSLRENSNVIEIVPKGNPRFMLNPMGRLRIMFDQFSCLCLLYDMITLPIIMAWDLPVQGALYLATVATTIFWTIDLVLNFRTSYFYHGILVNDPAVVRRRYMRTWFILDLGVLFTNLSSLIVNDSHMDDSTSLQFFRFFKATRVLRIIGVMRVLKISEVLKRYADRTLGTQFQPLVDIPGLVFFLVFANHMIGCCWYAVGKYAPTDTGLRWLGAHVSTRADLIYADTTWSFQYWTTLHWSLTQMTPGSMSVQPENTSERVLNIVCLVIGMILFSSIISRLSAKLVQYTTMNQERTRVLEKLGSALRRMDISPQLASSAGLLARDRLAARETAATTYDEVLSILPEKMHLVIYYEMCRQHLRHPLFRWWMAVEEIAVRIAYRKSMSFVNLNKEDTLFLASAPAASCYIAVRGQLRYSQDPENSKVANSRAKSVELNTLVAEPAMWCLWTHVGTAEAEQHSEVLEVNCCQLLHAVQQSPATLQVFRAYGTEFHARLVSSRPPIASFPSDLAVPHTTFGEILPFMKSNVRQIVSMACVQQMRENVQSASVYVPFKLHRSQSLGLDDFASVDYLSEKVYAGTCSMSFNSLGEIDVVECVVYVRLHRPDGRTFAVLGPVSEGGKWKSNVQWPQTHLQNFVGTIGTVMYLAEQWLGTIGQEVVLEEYVRRSTVSSKQTGCNTHNNLTHHLGLDGSLSRTPKEVMNGTGITSLIKANINRTKIGSILRNSFVVASSVPCAKQQDLSVDEDDEQDIANDDIDEAASDSSTKKDSAFRYWLCAWLTAEEFDGLSGDDSARSNSEERLRAVMSDILITPEILSQARDNYDSCRCGAMAI